jgi:hypothetical protein
VKVFSFILSAYILFLNTVPCCAIDNCNDELVSTGQVANHEKDDKNNCGNCSPFFTCAGCVGFSILVRSIHFESVQFSSENKFAGYILSPIPDVHYDFWQPPRFS